jgi:hypothetical protein
LNYAHLKKFRPSVHLPADFEVCSEEKDEGDGNDRRERKAMALRD